MRWSNPWPFFIGYALVGSTDFFDGWLARALNQRTDFGKTLDSVADIFFYLSSAYFFSQLFPQYLAPHMRLLIVFFVVFGLSFVVSWITCGKPIMMHTTLLRINGVLVYALILASHFVNTSPMVVVVLGIYLLGFTEEILIFLKYGEVDPDTRSILSLRRK